MKQLHHVYITVFGFENEDQDKITNALKTFAPFDLEKEKIKIKTINATSAEDKPIYIYELKLSKTRHTNAFIDHLNEILRISDRHTILDQLDSRIDDDLNFYVRFEKSTLLQKGKVKLTEGGDCFHIKMNVAAYPNKVSLAKKIIEDFLEKA